MRPALSVVVVGLVALSAVAAVPAAAGATGSTGDATTYRSPTTTGQAAASGGVAAPAAASGDTAARTAASNHDACAPLADGDPPANPASDRLGWENGCWYNESIGVTPGDGLNDTELAAVVGRSMARVEEVRQLEFDQSVPVEVISREEYRSRQSEGGTSTSTANSLHQNVKWEAMFSIGEGENALEVFQSTRTATVGGFYNFAEDRIVIISENVTTPQMNEITLSQELFHALQDQKLRISFDRSTREGNNAGLGIIEGDGNLVDRFYEQRCDREWDCLLPRPSNGSGGGTDSINYGVYLTQYQPYSDGPKFVRGIYNRGGWDAVNAVYENPPVSTEQVIHPEKYPDETPADIAFRDTSGDEWTIPDLGQGSVNYAIFGEAGLAAMMIRPYYASQGFSTPVVGPQDFFNLTTSGDVSSFDPLNYGFEAVAGWGNDRLFPYVTDDSAETNETGYVWKTVWDTEADAAEFAGAYGTLLEYYGASPVDGRQDTYRIPDDREFGDAFYVNHTGATVTLVNAPTVEQLDDVRAGAAPESVDATPTATVSPTPTPTVSPTPSPTPTATPTVSPTPSPTPTDAMDGGTPTDAMDGGTPTDTPTEGSSDGGPGFGVAAALVGLVLAAFALRRRR